MSRYRPPSDDAFSDEYEQDQYHDHDVEQEEEDYNEHPEYNEYDEDGYDHGYDQGQEEQPVPDDIDYKDDDDEEKTGDDTAADPLAELKHSVAGSKIFDFRFGKLPKGIEVVGTYTWGKNPDGSTHLELGPESYLNVETDFKPLGQDQLINNYTIITDLKLNELPAESMALYQTQAVLKPTDGEAFIDHTGGVGMFNIFGESKRRLQPNRWARTVIAYGRESGKTYLNTYVNGRQLAKIQRGVFDTRDGRFALLPFGFRMFYSQKPRFMPGGVKIKLIEVANTMMTADQVAGQSRLNRSQGFWDAEAKRQERIRTGQLSFFPAYPKKTPATWQHPSFLGLFADSHASTSAGCDHAGALIGLDLILRKLLATENHPILSQLSSEDLSVLASISGSLSNSTVLAKKLQIVRDISGALPFVRRVVDLAGATKEGDMLIIPSSLVLFRKGMQPLAFVLERTSENKFSLAITNVTLGFGLEYHPSKPENSGAEIKYMVTLPIEDIPEERIIDEVFWVSVFTYAIQGSYEQEPDVLYSKILGLLSDAPFDNAIAAAFNGALESKMCPFRPLPRAPGLKHFSVNYESMLYMMRRAGIAEPQIKLIETAIRMQAIDMTKNDLLGARALPDADSRIIRIGTEVMAHYAAKLSEECPDLVTPTMLFATKRLVDVVSARVDALPCSDILTRPLPDLLQLHDKGASKKILNSDYTWFDRLRREDVDGLAGPPVPRSSYLPVDFTQVLRKVHTLDEIVDTLRYVDKLCTLISCQVHCIKNPAFLKVALLEHTFTQVIPIPRPPLSPDYETCPWRTQMRYALQLDILILLQRLVEHFTSSAMSIMPTRPFDAVRIIVPACIAALADTVLRRRATDIPSDLSIVLIELQAGLSTAAFAAQTEIIEVHTPELNIARTAALDYFHGLGTQLPILSWEDGNGFQRETNQLFATMAQRLAFPMGQMEAYMTASGNYLLVKNYPEFACYRDISYHWKFFLNPDPGAFPPTADYQQIHFQLDFQLGNGTYVIKTPAGQLTCRPRPNAPPNIQRYYTRTLAQSYIPAKDISARTEDDILHIKTLPDFKGCVGQADSEQLLSFLTVPYLRIPLILGFFATEDRIHSLRSKQVQTLFESALFEPGKYLPLNYNRVPEYVPTPDSTQLATPYGLLINELVHSPEYLLTTVIKLVKLALNLDTGTVFSSTVPIILFVLRTAARVENYASMVLNYAQDTHESLHKASLRDVSITPETVETLATHLKSLRLLLRMHGHRLLDIWQVEVYNRIREAMIEQKKRAEAEAAARSNTSTLPINISSTTSTDVKAAKMEERKLKRKMLKEKMRKMRSLNMGAKLADIDDADEEKDEDLSQTGAEVDSVDECHRIACNLHAHSLLFYRNVTDQDLDMDAASTLLSASMYLTIHHTWNQGLLSLPENEIFELMHTTRIKLIKFIRSRTQVDLNKLMELLLTVSVGSAVRDARGLTYVTNEEIAEATAEQVTARGTGRKWAYVFGPRSVGRFGVSATPMHLTRKRLVDRLAERNGVSIIEEIRDTSDLSIDVDVQLIQVTLKNSHLRSLPTEIAGDQDVVEIFGYHVMQAATVEDAQNREWVRLVGRGYDLHYWKTPDERTEPQSLEREYDPSELDESELWIYNLFEPVRQQFFMFPQPLPVVIQERTVPATASVAVLMVLHPKKFFNMFEVHVYRDLKMVQIFSIHSHGRLFYRTLVYTTNSYLTLADMQPSPQDRQTLWPAWGRHEAGRPTPVQTQTQVVITRDPEVPENLSGCIETFIPARLLCGIVPQALTDAYRFWQDPTDNLRGYPIDKNSPHVIFVQLENREKQLDTLNPGTSARITRMTRTAMEEALEASIQDAEKKFDEEIARMEKDPAALEALVIAQNQRRMSAIKESSTQDDLETEETKQPAGDEETKVAAAAAPDVAASPSASTASGSISFEDALPPVTEEQLKLVRTKSAEAAASRVLSMSAAVAIATGSTTGSMPPAVPSLQRGASVVSEAGQADRKTLDEETLELVNLITAPKGSALAGIADTLQKVENLSYVLAWKRPTGASRTSDTEVETDELELPLIDLPRLKLCFHTRYDEQGIMRMYSMDHTNLYVSNERSPLIQDLVRGIPHALLLENATKELHILVPCVLPIRPSVMSSPFSTELVLMRTEVNWLEQLDTRYYLYPVHVSLSFMFTPTLSSALYLLILRFLNRLYDEVFRIADTIGTDTAFTGEEKMLFEAIALANADMHPNACASRLKIAAVTAVDAPDIRLPFDLTTMTVAHGHRAQYISAVCRIQRHEELALLAQSIRSENDPRFDRDVHTIPMVIDANNRYEVLRVLIRKNSQRDASETSIRVRVIPRRTVVPVQRPATIGPCVLAATGQNMSDEYLALSPLDLAQISEVDKYVVSNKQPFGTAKLFSQTVISTLLTAISGQEGFDGAKLAYGFLFAYTCYTGEASIKVASTRPNTNVNFGRLFGRNLAGRGLNAMTAILDLLDARPELGAQLPKWKDHKPPRKSTSTDAWPGDITPFIKLILEKLQEISITDPESLCMPQHENHAPPAQIEQVQIIDDKERDWILPTLSDYSCDKRRIGLISPQLREKAEAALVNGTLSLDIFSALFSSPLTPISVREYIASSTRSEKGLPALDSELSFDVSKHPDTTSAVAMAMRERIAHDVAVYAQSQNTGKSAHFVTVGEPDAKRYLKTHPTFGTSMFDNPSAAKAESNEPSLADAIALTEQLIDKLVELGDNDRDFVKSAISFIRNSANKVDLNEVKDVSVSETKDGEVADSDTISKLRYLLFRHSGMEPVVWIEYVIGALLSSRAVFDLQKLNPFFDRSDIELVFCVVEAMLLRANRIGQVNRSLNDARDLLRLLKRTNSRSSFDAPDPALLAGLVQTSESLARNLSAERHYGKRVEVTEAAFDEAKEFQCANGLLTTDVIARAKRSTLQDEILTNEAHFPDDTAEQIPRYVSPLERAERMGAFGVHPVARCGASAGASGMVCYEYDPRYLVFEFTWNILLRKSQVEMVNDFVDCITNGKSRVKQMIMGAGKTTVVAPLLTLILGNGKQLVMEVVPPALLEFSRSVMRSTFSSIMYKRIYTLHFDRSAMPDGSLYNKLRSAISNSGVVISTPTSVKSVLLKFLELEQILSDVSLRRSPEYEAARDQLARILRLFRQGVLLMDEVDLILHPLKSELNFPVGAKYELDFQPLRWKMAIHILDGLFYMSGNRMASSFRDSKRAYAVLRQLADLMRAGIEARHIQNSPHPILLNVDYYHETLKPVVADWLMLWIEAQHITGISYEDMKKYILNGPLKEPEIAAAMDATLPVKHRKALNLARDWLKSYLPHVFEKIDRVSFGLLTPNDLKLALAKDPRMPPSRAKLVVPFVGKDVPSQSSEFAHPDVIIGLTILAYRYEGLRMTDFTDIIESLRATMVKEAGPFHLRQSSIRFARWIQEAGGRVRGRNDFVTGENSDGSTTSAAENADIVEVVPLHLLKRSNTEQMEKIFKLLYLEPEVIHWYLNEFIFPTYMLHQKTKLSAAGTELGGEMLFSRRVGFSGTPSDLLPLELGHCDYEKGSDGQMLSVLTSPEIVSYTMIEEGWNVKSLLNHIATAKTSYGAPRYHALIDTGALVTGMTNQQVAEYLLDHGLEWAEGVVFLDEEDRKMILVRATRRVVKLAQCGIAKDRRFAFYDQVHTTGMDIQHRLDACAALTLGKDMVFRDYSQGAYRMRGIAKGQTIHLLIIPEIERLIARELARCVPPELDVNNKLVAAKYQFALDRTRVLERVAAWLVINSMQSERVQFNQLCLQNVANVWRKNAFNLVLSNYNYFNIANFPDPEDELAVQKAQERGERDPHLLRALYVFMEPIDFTIEETAPAPQLFSESIGERIAEHDRFIYSDEERAVIQQIVDTVSTSTLETVVTVLTAEMVQTMEEEKEKQQEQEQEQEIEIEKYVDLAYSREDEEQQPWAANMLALGGTPEDGSRAPVNSLFYNARDFKLYKRNPLHVCGDVIVSNNYFNKKWGGVRRIKNIVMLLDWIPSLSRLVTRSDALALASTGKLDLDEFSTAARKIALEGAARQGSELAFSKAFDLYDLDNSGGLDEHELTHMLRAVTDAKQTPEVVQLYLKVAAGGASQMDKATMKRLYESGALQKEQSGRWVVVLSLAEAETLRRLMHARLGKSFQTGTDSAVALRCSTHGNAIFDRTKDWQPAPERQTLEAWQTARFLNNETHFSDSQITVLMLTLEAHTPRERQRYFEHIMNCRRRMRKRWLDAPVAKLFTLPTGAHLLKQRAQSWRMRTAILQRGMLFYDAFRAFDANRNGLLAADELYGALEWLGVKNLTPDDILDFISTEDSQKDGNLRYKDFLELVKDPDADLEGTTEGEDVTEQKTTDLPVIVPKATEELAALVAQRRLQATLEEDAERKHERDIEMKFHRELFQEEEQKNLEQAGGPNPNFTKYDHLPFLEYDFMRGTDPIHIDKGGDQLFKGSRGSRYYVLHPKAYVACATPTSDGASISARLDNKRQAALLSDASLESKITEADTLNKYTVILYVSLKTRDRARAQEPLLAFRRSDGGVVMVDTSSQVLSIQGETPVESKLPKVPNAKWTFVTLTVDAEAQVVRLGVEGGGEAAFIPADMSKYIAQGYIELFVDRTNYSSVESRLRKVLVIPRALQPLQIREVIAEIKRSVAWQCPQCTSANDPDANVCTVCRGARPNSDAPPANCPVCTYVNRPGATRCEVCETPLSSDAPDSDFVAPAAPTGDEDDELEAALRASLGNTYE